MSIPERLYVSKRTRKAKQFFIQLLFILLSAVVTGLLVALFLWLLDWATITRFQNQWLIFLLPLAGIFIVLIYKRYGKNSVKGNNLIIEEIHRPGGGVPARMTPLVLITTVITHLFGGSAGREGTAVQMGGSITAFFTKWMNIEPPARSLLLQCGIAAGFGAVFGTPLAGAIFAIEVLIVGYIQYRAFLYCLLAAIVGHLTCIACGAHHTHYSIDFSNLLYSGLTTDFTSILLYLKTILAGIVFGGAAIMFVQGSHRASEFVNKTIHPYYIAPVIGGALIIGISFWLGTFDYLGLGVINPGNGVSITAAFMKDGATTFSWLWKLLLTVITLSTGFKGGEVTPLFFIGATLGNTLAAFSGSPVDLFAGLGFIAVFAGATKTPLACTIMGAELFGIEGILYYALACYTAYLVSGTKGIYHSQKIAR